MRGGKERTRTKNACCRNVDVARSGGKRVKSGFKTVEDAANATKEAMAMPSQESMTGMKDVITVIFSDKGILNVDF